MSKRIYVGGRIESAEQGGVVTGANAIFDDTKGKKQNVINSETDNELARLDNAKQDVLTFDNAPTEGSNNPVKSGGVYAADAALQQAIEAILQLIPSAATALNQLADKAFVNSTVATDTATFRGTYNVVTDLSLHYNSTHQEIETALLSVVQTADNNDYCFVQIPVSDSSGDIRVTERYKFNGTAWSYEYDLNNSGFTADQWAAINSTITLALVQKLGALPTAAELAQQLALKQNTLTFDSAPVADSSNPVTSGGLYNIIAAINATIPSGASVDNKLVAESRLTQYVAAIVNALDATFNVTSTDGHVNVRLTQVDGVITSVEVITNDIASASALSTLAGRVTTNEGNISLLQALYNALQQSAPVIIQPTDTWPVASPSATVIYRVIERVNTPPQYYSDYMFSASDLTTPVLMAQYNNAIDDEPTAGSDNLVKSGGVYESVSHSTSELIKKTYGLSYTYSNLLKTYSNKWIEANKIGMDFFEAVEAETNTYGDVSTNLIPANKGTSIYMFYNGQEMTDWNRVVLEIGFDNTIIGRYSWGANTNQYSIQNNSTCYIAVQWPHGYDNTKITILYSNSVSEKDTILFRDKELAYTEQIDSTINEKTFDYNGLKIVYGNLIKSLVNKWIDTESIGLDFLTAVQNSQTTYGNISVNLIHAIKGTKVYLYNNTSQFTYDNRKAIEIDKNGKIISILSFAQNTNEYNVSNDDTMYVAVEYPAGYGLNSGLYYQNEVTEDRVSFQEKDLAFLSDVFLWKNKKCCTYGDSITEYGFWQSALQYYFKLSSITNRGISGSKLTNIDPFMYWVDSETGETLSTDHDKTEPDPSWENPIRIYSNFSCQERINTVPTDCDLVIIMGGTNDSSVLSPSYGEGDCEFDSVSGTFNESTIKGAVCETIRKMQIRCPNAVIVFATPLSGLGSYSDNHNYNQNYKINEIATAIKEASFYMSTPVIDVFGTCGINISNSASYLKNDKTHPTYGSENNSYNGASMISRAIIGGLMTILPHFKGGADFNKFA